MPQKLNTAQIDNLSGPLPVYRRYPHQVNPQGAYISLDIRTGAVEAAYNPEIGNAVPSDVWRGLVRRYEIPCDTSASGIGEMIANISDDLRRVLTGSRVAWDGNNHVARTNNDANEAEGRIEYTLSTEYDTDETPDDEAR